MSDYLSSLAVSSAISVVAAFTAPGLQAANLSRHPIQVVDARDKTVVFDGPVKRIVSLQPSFTEAICALGACERLVGVDRFSSWPVTVTDLPKVGSLRDPDIEKILALKPDVVLVRPNHRLDEKLEKLGIKVLTLNAQTHGDVARELEVLSTLLGKPGQGTSLWQQTTQGLERYRQAMPREWIGKKVYFELHSGMAAAGKLSFIGQTLQSLGLVNIVDADLPMYPKLSPEYVLRANPDVVITMAEMRDPQPAERPGWGTLAALRSKRFCQIPNANYDVMVRPGPRIDEAARQIVECLQKLPVPSGNSK